MNIFKKGVEYITELSKKNKAQEAAHIKFTIACNKVYVLGDIINDLYSKRNEVIYNKYNSRYIKLMAEYETELEADMPEAAPILIELNKAQEAAHIEFKAYEALIN